LRQETDHVPPTTPGRHQPEAGHVGLTVRKGPVTEPHGTGYPIRYPHYYTGSDLVGFGRR
jgi:hypothetical protein